MFGSFTPTTNLCKFGLPSLDEALGGGLPRGSTFVVEQTIGADAVGFSTVMETIAAVHAGIEVLGLATITNVCTPQKSVPADVDKIISVAESTAPQILDIITCVIEQF